MENNHTAETASISSPARFKVVASPPTNSPSGSTKMNHLANNSAHSASTPSPPPMPPLAGADCEDMQPREAVIHNVPSIELPEDGKKKHNPHHSVEIEEFFYSSKFT